MSMAAKSGYRARKREATWVINRSSSFVSISKSFSAQDRTSMDPRSRNSNQCEGFAFIGKVAIVSWLRRLRGVNPPGSPCTLVAGSQSSPEVGDLCHSSKGRTSALSDFLRGSAYRGSARLVMRGQLCTASGSSCCVLNANDVRPPPGPRTSWVGGFDRL